MLIACNMRCVWAAIVVTLSFPGRLLSGWTGTALDSIHLDLFPVRVSIPADRSMGRLPATSEPIAPSRFGAFVLTGARPEV